MRSPIHTACRSIAGLAALLTLMMLALAGCGELTEPDTRLAEAEGGPAFNHSVPIPASLTTVTAAGSSLTLWPYTATTLAEQPSDPINLIFGGIADPRNIRDALLALDGVRGGPFAGFDCTWTDAIGGIQATYGSDPGWTGSVIQLECGTYEGLRMHVRLFPMGDRTVANAHIDVLIPGTTDHQVISWEVAEQFVTADLARAGVLGAAPTATAGVTAAPTFREIPAILYNGLPPQLKALAGGPGGTVSEPVGIANDGRATILVIARDVPAAGGRSQTLELDFAQVIPKPFCAEPGELVRVDGPVSLTQEVRVSATGVLSSQTFAEGELQVRSFDPTTGATGDPMTAHIRDHYRTQVGDHLTMARSSRHQLLESPGAPAQQLQVLLRVGSDGEPMARARELCG